VAVYATLDFLQYLDAVVWVIDVVHERPVLPIPQMQMRIS